MSRSVFKQIQESAKLTLWLSHLLSFTSPYFNHYCFFKLVLSINHYCFNLAATYPPESAIIYSRTEYFLQNTVAVFLYSHFNRKLEAYHVLAASAVEKLPNNDLV